MPRAAVAMARASRRARVFNLARGVCCDCFQLLVPAVLCIVVLVLRKPRLSPGFYGKRKNCYAVAKRATDKAMQKMYIGRKEKKRDMRALWINRINAASRLHGTPYSRLMNNLVVSDVRDDFLVGTSSYCWT